VRAAGVNPVDAYIRAGTYARKPNLPYIPGADLGGVVEAVGEGVTRLITGARVYAHSVPGTYAELAVCDEWQAYPLPESRVIRARRRAWRAVRDRVARADDSGPCARR
jgi:NADPH2:quinone reductase